MKQLLLLGGFILTTLSLFSQIEKPVQRTYVTAQRINNWSFPEIENFDGSYQFIVKDKKEFILTDEVFSFIESSRREDEDVRISLNLYLDIFILGKNKVADPSAERFNEVYIIK